MRLPIHLISFDQYAGQPNEAWYAMIKLVKARNDPTGLLDLVD